jgi:quercetin dioxygenase-like cupin family protein
MPVRKKKQPFGKRLMQLRRKQKMSLKNLANETGLSAKYLSQMEKGEVIPPVAVILQVSRAMEIDSSILLREEKKQAGKKADDDYRKRTADYTYETLTPEAQHKHLKAFKIFIDPKSDHKGVSYQHLGEEFIYVLKGKIEVMVGENKNTLGPGDSLHFNSSIVHKMRNISNKKAEMLVILFTP